MRDPKTVLATMEPWLKDRGSTETTQSRTAKQRAWDSAVFACSEFVRRLTDYDESLAGAVHLLLTPKSQVAESGEPSSSTPAQRIRELKAEVEQLRRELQIHRDKARGAYWAWQGDDEDHLESLTCPVLIHPRELQLIVEASEP